MSVLSAARKWVIQQFAKSVLSDVAKGEYGMNAKKIWDWLNGRKTAIGLLVTFLVSLQTQLPGLIEAFGAGKSDADMWGNVLGQVVIVVGALHKAIKGN
jgi:hypothetical protein